MCRHNIFIGLCVDGGSAGSSRAHALEALELMSRGSSAHALPAASSAHGSMPAVPQEAVVARICRAHG